jgi:hypothetical protein
MEHLELRKSLHAPTVHTSHHFGMPVRTSVFQGHVPADAFEALAAEHLNSVGDGANAVGPAALEFPVLLLADETAGEAQLRILVELREQPTVVGGLEGYVRIHIANESIITTP